MKKLIAGLLSAALVLLSPGLSSYQALAATGKSGSGKTPAPSLLRLAAQIPSLQTDLGVPSAPVPPGQHPKVPAVGGAIPQPVSPAASASSLKAASIGRQGPASLALVQPEDKPLAEHLADAKTDKKGLLDGLFDRIQGKKQGTAAVEVGETVPEASPSLLPAVASAAASFERAFRTSQGRRLSVNAVFDSWGRLLRVVPAGGGQGVIFTVVEAPSGDLALASDSSGRLTRANAAAKGRLKSRRIDGFAEVQAMLARVNAFRRAQALERAETNVQQERQANLSLNAEARETKIIREALAGSSARTLYAYFTTGGELISASLHETGERGVPVEFEVLRDGSLLAATAGDSDAPSELNAKAQKALQAGAFAAAVAVATAYNAAIGRPRSAALFAHAKPRVSLREKAVDWIKKRFDLSDFTKSEKSYIKGQALFLLAISIYMASLPLLVSAITGDTALTGVLRAVHYTTFGLVSLVAGYNVKESPMKSVLVNAARGRAVLFGTMGATVVMVLLFAPAYLPWLFPFLIVIAAMNSVLVAHNHLVDIDTGGAQKVFNSDKKIERAGYAYDTIFYGMMLVMPALIGLPMDLIDSFLGAGVGAALGFASFGYIMTKVASIYKKDVVVIGETFAGTLEELLGGVKKGMRKAWARLMDKSPMTARGRKVALTGGLLAAGAAAAFAFIPGAAAAAAAIPVLGAGLALVGGPLIGSALILGIGGILLGTIIALQGETFKVIIGNRAIAARWSLSTLEQFIEDALFAVVLPSFVIDVLFAGDKGLGGFSPQAFANGLMLGATTLGGILASNLLLKKAVKLEESLGRYRLLKYLTAAAALCFVPTIGLWAFPAITASLGIAGIGLGAKAALFATAGAGLLGALKLKNRAAEGSGAQKAWTGVSLALGFLAVGSLGAMAHPALFVALPAVLLMKLMLQPLRSRMRALLQTSIKNDPIANKHRDDIFGLMSTVEVLAAAAGGLAFAWLFTHSAATSVVTQLLGALAPMKIVTLSLVVLGVVSIASLFWMRPELIKPVQKTHPPFVGDATKAMLDRVESLLDGARAARDERSKLYPRVTTAAEAAARQVRVARARAQAARALLEQAASLSRALPEVPEAGAARRMLADFSTQVSAGKLDDAVKTLSGLHEELVSRHQEMLDVEKLRNNLARMKLPAYREVTVKEGDPRRPAVAILAPASPYKLSIALEGGRQAPGDVHLVMSTNWLIEEILHDGRTKLFIKKALVFDAQGQATLVTYETPRQARYFANFLTPGANDRDDGVPYERNLDVPQSNSLELEKTTNDKLLTRLMLAAKGVAVPMSLALLMAAHPLHAKIKAAGLSSQAPGVSVTAMPKDRAKLKQAIEAFLQNYRGDEVVVKPSGPNFHSGRGVKFFKRHEVAAMVDHVLALQGDPLMTSDGAVLIDERLTPPALWLRWMERGGNARVFLKDYISAQILSPEDIPAAARNSPKDKKDWNIRVLVARTPWGGARTTGMFVRAGAWGSPTTAEPANPADAAAVVRYEDALRALKTQHGLLQDPDEEAAFTKRLKDIGENALLAIAEEDRRLAAHGRGSYQGRTDYIGLDVMVVSEGGVLVPKIIEVNDHDAGGQWQLDLFSPGRAGEHSREWIATMLERAALDALKGKTIVVVGAGYPSKRFIFEKAKKLGVKVILVADGSPWYARLPLVGRLFKQGSGEWARGLVDEFIATDTAKREKAVGEAVAALKRLQSRGVALDGIRSFWEDDLPLASGIAKELGLSYHSEASAMAVRDKFLSRERMKAAGLRVPRYALARAPQTAGENSLKEFEAALKTVGFPAVIKPKAGAAAIGVRVVWNREEALAARERIISMTVADDSTFSYGNDIVVDQYLDGPEFDANFTVQDGEVKFFEIVDNWPVRLPYALATGSSSPSRVLDAEQKELIRRYVLKADKALGLGDGVRHFEGKVVKEDGRWVVYLFDPNGRVGGHYVPFWSKKVWGRDVVQDEFMIAAGIAVRRYNPAEPLIHLEGEFIIPDQSGRVQAFGLSADGLQDPGLYMWDPFKFVGDRIAVPPSGFERMGMLQAQGADAAEAQANLGRLRAQMILDIVPDGRK